jgi:hypothetical protein
LHIHLKSFCRERAQLAAEPKPHAHCSCSCWVRSLAISIRVAKVCATPHFFAARYPAVAYLLSPCFPALQVAACLISAIFPPPARPAHLPLHRPTKVHGSIRNAPLQPLPFRRRRLVPHLSIAASAHASLSLSVTVPSKRFIWQAFLLGCPYNLVPPLPYRPLSTSFTFQQQPPPSKHPLHQGIHI